MNLYIQRLKKEQAEQKREDLILRVMIYGFIAFLGFQAVRMLVR